MLLTFKEYKTKFPESSLTILGAGPLESELKQFAKTLGISASVQFLGRSSQIFDFLGKLDAFILTSKYEGFGMVLLEAMDAGVPIIASDNSAIPEVLGNDFPGLCPTGDYMNFAEKITKLNNAEYREFVLRKQEYQLKFFDAESMAAKILEIYVSSTHE
jgi:glycosyltransferase involved in cell wall biosynthesis